MSKLAKAPVKKEPTTPEEIHQDMLNKIKNAEELVEILTNPEEWKKVFQGKSKLMSHT